MKLVSHENSSALLVSVLINNYNYGDFVSKAIESVLGQTYKHIEVIVVDDGSSDNSLNVIKNYKDAVTLIAKSNGGQASAINSGFKVSHGQIITLLDADDYLFSDSIERIVQCWKSQSDRAEIAQIQCSLELVDPKGQHIDVYPRVETPFDDGDVVPLLLHKGRYRTTVTSGLSFSRSALEKIMPIPEEEFRISADGYLVTTAPFFGRVVSITSPIAARVYHNNNLWSNSTGKGAEEKFQKSVSHDLLRYKYLELLARKFEYELVDEPGLRDLDHLINRVASLRMQPRTHPISSDSPFVLGFLGCRAAYNYSKLKLSRRLILCAWFLWVSILPSFLSKPAVLWFRYPKYRPKFMISLAKKVRSITR